MSLCVVHIPISWNYAHLIQIYICPPRTPLFLFDYMFSCPRLASFASLSLSISFYFLLYSSANLFLLSLHAHAWSMDTWSKGATSQVQAKRVAMQAHKGQCLVDQEAQPLLSGFLFLSLSLSLSLSLFSRACIRVLPLLVPFLFPVLCLGCIPWI